MFGGNSNWRGPVWFPLNYLLIEALERYHHFYGDALQGRVPHRAPGACDAAEVAHALSGPAARRCSCPTRTAGGRATATTRATRTTRHWRDLVLFYEFFHGDTGRGLGASHQTGWTALVIEALRDIAEWRKRAR